ncbi:MAG: heme ABC transporter ATP-binding protein [Hyphomicrobiaceae bacterium]|nr:heme ABC transporter ATP-binding protein [Hyphomicrobiaceae bacterium]
MTPAPRRTDTGLAASALAVAVTGRHLIADVTLRVAPGEIVVVAGPNGAGKSTLLRCLSGELRPSSGSVTLDGVPVSSQSAAALALRRAVVPQASVLHFPFTVAEVVALAATVPGLSTPDARQRAAITRAMARADVGHLAGRLYPTLSGGERQRVHLARALCQLALAPHAEGTRALLLDEPTASLDISHQLMILEAAREEARTGIAVLAILHDLNLAATFADRIALMACGRLLAIARPAAILDDARLSGAFACTVCANRPPPGGEPYVLPQACAAGPRTLA